MARLEAAVQKQFLSQAHQPGIGGAHAFWLGIIAVVLVDIGVPLAIPTNSTSGCRSHTVSSLSPVDLSVSDDLGRWHVPTRLRALRRQL